MVTESLKFNPPDCNGLISWVALVTTGPKDLDLARHGTRRFRSPGQAPVIIEVVALGGFTSFWVSFCQNSQFHCVCVFVYVCN